MIFTSYQHDKINNCIWVDYVSADGRVALQVGDGVFHLFKDEKRVFPLSATESIALNYVATGQV